MADSYGADRSTHHVVKEAATGAEHSSRADDSQHASDLD
jgi:hypothetical protein